MTGGAWEGEESWEVDDNLGELHYGCPRIELGSLDSLLGVPTATPGRRFGLMRHFEFKFTRVAPQRYEIEPLSS